tara:strand:+ start:2414 stop:3328 length:915 start_codon:yes stop_codon:yes gene_type:complete
MQLEIKKLNIKTNYDTSKVSWLKSGGIAKYYCNIKNINQLTELFKFLNKNSIPFLTIGNFSNTLIKSSGFDGLLLKLSGDFLNINLNKETVTVGSSVLDLKFSMFCYENSICNYEYLYTIPGTIGGNIFMNAGCYGFEIKDQIEKIKIFDTSTLKIQELSADEMNFSYRKGFQEKNKIILSADLITKVGRRDSIKIRMKELDQKRNETQPRRANCCGSIFKNPRTEKKSDNFANKLSAWKLIQSSVDDSFYNGEVKLSKKHSNFFENEPYIDPDKLEAFLKNIEEKVMLKHNIKLEKELRIIGV